LEQFAFIVPWYLLPFTISGIVYTSTLLEGAKLHDAENNMKFRIMDYDENNISRYYWDICQQYVRRNIT